MLSRQTICTQSTVYRKWLSKYTHVYCVCVFYIHIILFLISKRYWGETILSPQYPGEYWGECPCCPCGVGAYAIHACSLGFLRVFIIYKSLDMQVLDLEAWSFSMDRMIFATLCAHN